MEIRPLMEFFTGLTGDEIVTSVSFTVGGIISGILFDRFIIKKILKLTGKTKWKGDDLIAESLKGFLFLWFFLTGLYLAILTLPFEKSIESIILKVLFVVVLTSLTFYGIKISELFIRNYSLKKEGFLPSSSIFSNIIKVVIVIVGLTLILQSLGVSITPIITALGVGGLAVALALQDTLTNLFAGIAIIASRHIRIGDYVRLATTEEGTIADITWRNTTVRTGPGNLIVIPNSKLASSILTNFNLPEKTIGFVVEVNIGYGADLEKVEELALKTAVYVLKNVKGGNPDYEPVVRFGKFGDYSIQFNIVLQAKEFTDQYLIKHELIKQLVKEFSKEGIKFPCPVREVHIMHD